MSLSRSSRRDIISGASQVGNSSGDGDGSPNEQSFEEIRFSRREIGEQSRRRGRPRKMDFGTQKPGEYIFHAYLPEWDDVRPYFEKRLTKTNVHEPHCLHIPVPFTRLFLQDLSEEHRVMISNQEGVMEVVKIRKTQHSWVIEGPKWHNFTWRNSMYVGQTWKFFRASRSNFMKNKDFVFLIKR